jgi:hypothetical protein
MSLPAWAQLSIIAAAVLLSPALALLAAIGVEIVIGVLVEAGVPLLPAFASGVLGYWCAGCGAAQGASRSRREKVR